MFLWAAKKWLLMSNHHLHHLPHHCHHIHLCSHTQSPNSYRPAGLINSVSYGFGITQQQQPPMPSYSTVGVPTEASGQHYLSYHGQYKCNSLWTYACVLIWDLELQIYHLYSSNDLEAVYISSYSRLMCRTVKSVVCMVVIPKDPTNGMMDL